ncbi:MAG: chemotaxis protein CheW [Thioalkalispiraceae bacterium]|jgi:twitching motility protein PilI
MSAATFKDPFSLLKNIEVRSQEKALGLPQQMEIRRTWSGIGFRVGETYLVSAIDEISEILTYPNMTSVPSSQNWIRGIANVRGILLPIMDFTGVVDGQSTKLGRKSRVLVIRQEDMDTGLVVDEVFGMRHFFDEEKTADLPQVSGRLQNFMKGAYRQGDRHWGIFSMRNLAKSEEFKNVAVRN